jgi:hypothetical protein
MMSDDTIKVSDIPLAKLIKDLRVQLLDAISEGEGEDLHFKLDPVELELSVGMTLEASGGVQFWVLAKGQVELAGSHSHKLKLRLTPIDKYGKGPLVGDTWSERPE